MSDDEPEVSFSEAAKQAKAGISRLDEDPRGRLQADLDRALTDKLMAVADVGAAVAHDFEAEASLALATLTDIDRALDAAGEHAAGTQQEMERLLAIETLSDLAAEGQRLNDLLDRGGISIDERSILKRGLLFMGRGMHREAAEWWTLNSPDDTSTRFYHLLKLLLALTYKFAGDHASADALIAQLRQSSKSVI